MPNGGPDNCGTCSYNAKNKGEVGYEHLEDREPDVCTIRQLPIQSALFTYCANHSYHNPDGLLLPVGPVFKADFAAKPHTRKVWALSPDTPEVRELLLALLQEMREQPTDDYPAGWSLDEAAVWQVGEFGELRAVADLERIASFDPNAQVPGEDSRFSRTRARIVELAQEALAKIRERHKQAP